MEEKKHRQIMLCGYISSVLPVEQPNIKKKKHIFSFITFLTFYKFVTFSSLLSSFSLCARNPESFRHGFMNFETNLCDCMIL